MSTTTMNKSIKLTIAIIGGGFVGSATYCLKCPEIKTIVYDICPEKCIPLGTTLKDFIITK